MLNWLSKAAWLAQGKTGQAPGSLTSTRLPPPGDLEIPKGKRENTTYPPGNNANTGEGKNAAASFLLDVWHGTLEREEQVGPDKKTLQAGHLNVFKLLHRALGLLMGKQAQKGKAGSRRHSKLPHWQLSLDLLISSALPT